MEELATPVGGESLLSLFNQAPGDTAAIQAPEWLSGRIALLSSNRYATEEASIK